MNVDEIVQYWIKSSEEDLQVVDHLFASGDYKYALFFGHLYLEKLLKALVVDVTRQHAPLTHNLVLLAERAELEITVEDREILDRITGYNIDTRYSAELSLARQHYNQEFCEKEIRIIKEIGEWVKSKLKHKKTS
jgi:HEPN domain-containing protein